MKLFLIDGHALIFKMYYAFLGRPMINSKGEDTSIIFGFTKYLIELIEREQPSHIAVAFDPPGGTFRNKLYPEYKANRPETPKLVIDALKPLTEIVTSLGIPVLMIPGFEADDVIGSMAKRSAAEGFDVYMVTPDKDYGQLIEAHIFQYKPGKGGSDKEILGVPEVCEKYSISNPLQVIDILALCGDSADNVPGVQGVGPVGAAKLLGKYHSVENIYEHLGELSAKQQEKFNAAADHIGLSKELVTIKTDIPLSVSAQDMAIKPAIGAEILSQIDHYEMPSIKKRISQIWEIEASGSKSMEFTDAGIGEVAEAARKSGFISVSSEDGMLAAAAGSLVCLCDSPEELKDILQDPAVTKCGYRLKADIKALDAYGISLQGKLLDAQIMHYLLNPESNHDLDTLCEQFLGTGLEAQDEKEQSDGDLFAADLFAQAASNEDRSALKRRSALCLQLAETLLPKLSGSEASSVYDRIEEPLIGVLARMEEAGVLVDLKVLSEFAGELREKIRASEEKVRAQCGKPELNLSSPKQIGELLFEDLKIDPSAKKPSKGSWPTDEETLLKYADENPIIEEILSYRASKKLLSTYIEPFPAYVSPADGRVHTSFNQALTATGRLSSSSPNLQNIPIRTEQGKEIRKAFTAAPGNVIISADYSQIELRLMAHWCGDEHMIEAFREGQDVHTAMAAKIFHKEISEVSSDERRIAKTANFGIMYGISAFGLAQRLHISRAEASKLIDDYYASFPAIRSFIDETLEGARRNGFVQTLFGRRRYVTDVNSRNAQIRAMAERNAVNAPIQGSAADIIKLAMTGTDKALRESGLQAKLVLQIHDELVVEAPKDELQAVCNILKEQMEGVAELRVPLTVECNYGDNWLEAHN